MPEVNRMNMLKNIMRFVAIVCLTLAIASGQDARPDLDAGRLQTGSFSFRTLVDGKEVGRSRIQIRRSADLRNYIFSNLVIGSFSQSWEAVASPTQLTSLLGALTGTELSGGLGTLSATQLGNVLAPATGEAPVTTAPTAYAVPGVQVVLPVGGALRVGDGLGAGDVVRVGDGDGDGLPPPPPTTRSTHE